MTLEDFVLFFKNILTLEQSLIFNDFTFPFSLNPPRKQLKSTTLLGGVSVQTAERGFFVTDFGAGENLSSAQTLN